MDPEKFEVSVDWSDERGQDAVVDTTVTRSVHNMTCFGNPADFTQRVVYILFASAVGALVPVQLVFLQKLIILPVRLLPLLSFCMCYENVLLALGDSVGKTDNVVMAGNAFRSVQIPLFVIILYEITFRLYQARSLQLSCLRFDLGGSTDSILAELSLWGTLAVCGMHSAPLTPPPPLTPPSAPFLQVCGCWRWPSAP